MGMCRFSICIKPSFSEQIDCSGSLAIDYVISFALFSFYIDVQRSYILYSDSCLNPRDHIRIGDAVFRTVLNYKGRNNCFLTRCTRLACRLLGCSFGSFLLRTRLARFLSRCLGNSFGSLHCCVFRSNDLFFFLSRHLFSSLVQ